MPVGQQHDAEQVHHPGEFHHQRGTQADRDRAQHDHAEDAPEQHAVLVSARGTAKQPKIIEMMKTLSIASVFSTR